MNVVEEELKPVASEWLVLCMSSMAKKISMIQKPWAMQWQSLVVKWWQPDSKGRRQQSWWIWLATPWNWKTPSTSKLQEEHCEPIQFVGPRVQGGWMGQSPSENFNKWKGQSLLSRNRISKCSIKLVSRQIWRSTFNNMMDVNEAHEKLGHVGEDILH